MLPGDANEDGRVDISDLGILAANYGAMSNAAWSTGDFNGDGMVDVSDLGILAANYGGGTGGADFNADAGALGLTLVPGENAAMETASEQTLELDGCSNVGLPLIAGLLLMGMKILENTMVK